MAGLQELTSPWNVEEDKERDEMVVGFPHVHLGAVAAFEVDAALKLRDAASQ